jgi:uroporphyrinogen-III synthase
VQFLEEAGAAVRTVQPYVYAPKADADRVVELIERLARGGVDVIAFPSTPQVDRLYEVPAERGLEPVLRQGLGRTRVAAVGPVVVAALQARGVPVGVAPEQGFVMKNLVQHIRREFEREAAP